MDCKERILKALNLEIPDRIPTHIIALDGNLVDKIIGGYPKTAFDLIKDTFYSFLTIFFYLSYKKIE